MSKPRITDLTQDTGLLNQPTIKELSETVRFVVPSEDRDFSRPRGNFWAQSLPADSSMADDSGNKGIKAIQLAMKGNPISPPYPGPIDGKVNRKLLDVLLNFSWTLRRKTGKTFNIVRGNSINQSEFIKAMKALNVFMGKEEEPAEKTEEEPVEEQETSDKMVLSFQKFFGTAHPLLGTLYSGPQDGVINDELISAAQKAELRIGTAIGTRAVVGMIWGGDGFVTSPDDVTSALEVIGTQKKSVAFSSQERLQIFDSILKSH